MVITMAKQRMAHASTHGARKPPGPKLIHVKMHTFVKTYFDSNLYKYLPQICYIDWQIYITSHPLVHTDLLQLNQTQEIGFLHFRDGYSVQIMGSFITSGKLVFLYSIKMYAI